jgi:REP element-mobilizing transposase RayT
MPIRENKKLRLENFDYSLPGWYYVTICTKDRIKYFGQIKNNKMIFNNYGQIVLNVWNQIPEYYKNVSIDESILMPNHLHGIIVIGNNAKAIKKSSMLVGTEHCSVPTHDTIKQKNNYGLLSKIIKSFKEITVKTIRQNYNDFDFSWQKSFYDHIIRKEYALYNIQKYIKENYGSLLLKPPAKLI